MQPPEIPPVLPELTRDAIGDMERKTESYLERLQWLLLEAAKDGLSLELTRSEARARRGWPIQHGECTYVTSYKMHSYGDPDSQTAITEVTFRKRFASNAIKE